MRIHRTRLPTRQRDDRRSLGRLLPWLWRYRWRVGLALALLLAAKVAGVAVPVLLRDIVDALDRGRQPLLALPVGLLAGYGLMRLFSSLFNELRDAIFARVRFGVMRHLSVAALAHLHRLSLRFHFERRVGQLARDVERGAASAAALLNYLVFSILPTLVEATLITVILLARYQAAYALVVLGTVLLYVAFSFGITEWRMKFRVQMNHEDSAASGQAMDSLLNFETVRQFGGEGREVSRYDAGMARWEEAAVRAQTSMAALNFGQAAIIAGGLTTVMVLAARGVVDGSMSLGDLVLVNTFMLQLFVPLGTLGMVYSQVRHALSDMDQLFVLMEEPAEADDPPDARDLPDGPPEIVFDDVHFAYRPDQPVLRGVSFSVPAGQTVAVVGPSGAGKSTLARLLFRLWDVDAGAIRLGGTDLRRLRRASLRAAVGMVPQEPVMFNDSLRYNLAYACPQADETRLREALSMARLDGLLAGLPEGWDTLVGERGVKLSGGEKQRLAIARVILRRSPVLVFDEATSSLDSASERAIVAAMARVTRHRTTLIIAHRLSTVVHADRIVVLDQGRVVASGSHAELVAAGGLYARLWHMQRQERADAGVKAGTAPD